MALSVPGVKQVSKFLPRASGIVGAGIVGVGSYKIARFVDGMLGNRIQSIGIGLPIIGSLSLLDVVMILAFKATMRKNSMVIAAVAGDRVLNLAQNPIGLIPNISLGASPINSLGTSTGSPGGGI